jgi:diguanylate cyclase (GGDEF)-like protein
MDLVGVRSAHEALQQLEAACGDDCSQAVDLVLMDINMPGIDGIKATRMIKEHPALRDIPIIIVTVSDELETLEKAFEAGAIDYINKPVNSAEMLVRVRSALRLKLEMDQRKARERELEELTRKLQELSNQDGLTGVANRRCFEDILQIEWLRARREQTPISLLMIDLDFFKPFNDTYGHLQGDVCLIAIATAIRNALKRPADLVARYGGEEFAAVLPHTDSAGAQIIATAIAANVASLDIDHEASTVSKRVTVSIGVATLVPGREQETQAFIEASDAALYQAKREGRNCIRVHKAG